MTTQLALELPSPRLTGAQCLPFFSDGLKRLLERGIAKPGQPIYLLKNGDHSVCTWSGRGKRPGWVEHWLAEGGTLSDIEVVIQNHHITRP